MSADPRVCLEHLRKELVQAGCDVKPVIDSLAHKRPEFVIRATESADRTVWCEAYEGELCFRWQPSTVDPIAPVDDVDAAVRVIRAYLAAAAD